MSSSGRLASVIPTVCQRYAGEALCGLLVQYAEPGNQWAGTRTASSPGYRSSSSCRTVVCFTWFPLTELPGVRESRSRRSAPRPVVPHKPCPERTRLRPARTRLSSPRQNLKPGRFARLHASRLQRCQHWQLLPDDWARWHAVRRSSRTTNPCGEGADPTRTSSVEFEAQVQRSVRISASWNSQVASSL